MSPLVKRCDYKGPAKHIDRSAPGPDNPRALIAAIAKFCSKEGVAA